MMMKEKGIIVEELTAPAFASYYEDEDGVWYFRISRAGHCDSTGSEPSYSGLCKVLDTYGIGLCDREDVTNSPERQEELRLNKARKLFPELTNAIRVLAYDQSHGYGQGEVDSKIESMNKSLLLPALDDWERNKPTNQPKEV